MTAGVRTSELTVRLLDGFDDPRLGAGEWNRLVERAGSPSIFLTWPLQRAWWDTQSDGELLLLLAERGGEPVAIAPFYVDSNMVMFVGTGFDYDSLDFVGETSDARVIEELMAAARDVVDEFEGFRLYFLRESSPSAAGVRAAAKRLGLSCYREDDMRAPMIDLGQRDRTLAILNRKRLRYYERALARDRGLRVLRYRSGHEILPQLDDFFEQHVARWGGGGNPSRFNSPRPRCLYKSITDLAADSGWLRFTRLESRDGPVAFQYGWCYRGRYFWGPASFAPAAAHYSPGQVLLRHLLLDAIEEGVSTFDFLTGDQPFKLRLATKVEPVRTWGIYPRS